MTELKKLINNLIISDLCELEDFMASETISTQPELEIIDGETYLDSGYIDLIKSTNSLIEYTRKVSKERNPVEYYHLNSKDAQTDSPTVQQLNYKDFLNKKNNFKTVFEYKFDQDVKELLQEIDNFIENNLNKTDSIYHLINISLIERISLAKSKLNNDLIPQNNNKVAYYFENHFGNYTDEEIYSIAEYMQSVLAKISSLENKLISRYSSFIKNKAEEYDISNIPSKIFKSTFGKKFFVRLHENYKDKTDNHLANYSFIYYAMKKDDFIDCKNITFIEFLASKFDIHIDKIDSRQSRLDNQRYNLYDSIKKSI